MYLDERSNILLKEVLSNPDTSNIKLEKNFSYLEGKLVTVFRRLMIGLNRIITQLSKEQMVENSLLAQSLWNYLLKRQTNK